MNINVNYASEIGFQSTVLHEMGHVLGFGTVWNAGSRSCMSSCTVGSRSLTVYQCPNAQAEFNALGCKNQLPIETSTGDDASDCSHWKESTLSTELMTDGVSG